MPRSLASSRPARTKPQDPSTGDRVLDAAADLIWEKGYSAATTRELASALHFQQASLYHHIASKEDMLYKLCLSAVQAFLTEVPAALEGVTDPAERLRALIRGHLLALLLRQKRNFALLTELRSLTPRHRKEVVVLRDNYRDLVRSILEEAQAAGVLRCDLPASYLVLVLLNLLNWSALWFRTDQVLAPEPLAALFIDIYLNGVTPPDRRRSWQLPDLEGTARKAAPRRAAKSTPARVREAAIALFSQKGYAATSTREVAALLGMQKASLYYHIDSKEDLLYLICKSSLETIHRDVEAALEDVADPVERIRALICAHMESMLKDAEAHSITLAEMKSLSKERFMEVLALRDAYEDLLRSVLGRAQLDGALREDIDLKYLALALLGLVNRVLVWYQRGGRLTPNQLGQMLGVIYLTGTAS